MSLQHVFRWVIVKGYMQTSKRYPSLLCRGFFLHRDGVLIAPSPGKFPHVFLLIFCQSIS